ncbi:MAG TPA: ABC transporter ATP-binding protein [Aquificales bacterium]|uniref:ABC transporter ATP-binding protein n=1 Tax=Aquifex aeolicus TaxID=63363 RepID=A0A9D0YPN2_AQUAO|nr:ABC transporter ATP-binding protein [Aquificales bacterium]HIP98371.1 ABC transporter ATP-binding protein [Aquifex aeolicus]
MKKPLLEVKNLTVKRGDKTVLRNFNLSLGWGEKLVLAGANGVGKTTFAETVLGFLPFEGEIFFSGKPIRDKKDFRNLRKKVGYVFQNPDDQLFMPTVRGELSFGPENLGLPPGAIGERVERVARKLGIKRLLDKSVFELSYGQKRLVSIACVLTMEPQLLILDEPTNGLDRENWERVANFLKKTEKAVLVITHDRELINYLRWKVIYLSEINFVSSLNLQFG